MGQLIVEEDVRREGLDDLLLAHAAEEEVLVDAHAVLTEGAQHTLMAHGIAGRDEGRAERTRIRGEAMLDGAERAEEPEEGPALHRHAGLLRLVLLERLEAVLLEDVLAVRSEEHGIPDEGDAHLVLLRPGPRGHREDLGGREAGLQRADHIGVVGGQEQVAGERIQIAIHGTPAGERGSADGDVQALDRLPRPQPRLRAVAGDDHHLDHGLTDQLVDPQQAPHERIAGAGGQRLMHVIELVLRVRLHPLALEHAMRLIQIKEGAGGDPDHQLVIELIGHALQLLPRGLYPLPTGRRHGLRPRVQCAHAYRHPACQPPRARGALPEGEAPGREEHPGPHPEPLRRRGGRGRGPGPASQGRARVRVRQREPHPRQGRGAEGPGLPPDAPGSERDRA